MIPGRGRPVSWPKRQRHNRVRLSEMRWEKAGAAEYSGSPRLSEMTGASLDRTRPAVGPARAEQRWMKSAEPGSQRGVAHSPSHIRLVPLMVAYDE